MPQLTTLDTRDPDEIRGILHRDGGAIVSGWLPDDIVQDIHAAFDRALAPLPWCNSDLEGYGDEFFGLKTKRLHGVLQYSPAIEAALTHPVALALAEEIVGESMLMSTGELMAIGPGEVQQALHRDADSWRRAPLEIEVLFSVNLALTGFREANGATVVVPGSHRWPRDREAQPSEFAYAEMAPGSALVYVGRVIHSGGANRTQDTRMGLYFGYVPGWLRPLENSAVTLPPDVVAGLSEPTRRLIGCGDNGFTVLL